MFGFIHKFPLFWLKNKTKNQKKNIQRRLSETRCWARRLTVLKEFICESVVCLTKATQFFFLLVLVLWNLWHSTTTTITTTTATLTTRLQSLLFFFTSFFQFFFLSFIHFLFITCVWQHYNSLEKWKGSNSHSTA